MALGTNKLSSPSTTQGPSSEGPLYFIEKQKTTRIVAVSQQTNCLRFNNLSYKIDSLEVH